MQARIEKTEKECSAGRLEVSRLSATLQQTAAALAEKDALLAASWADRARLEQQYAELLRNS
jgi:hypothetical protein